jgi:hypothetical protein
LNGLTPCANRTFAQGAELVYRVTDQPWKIIIRTATEEYGPLRVHPNLGQETPHRANTDFRPVVALGQTAFPLRTRHHEEPAGARLDGVQEILGVRLAAARQFFNLNVDTVLRPLARQMPSFSDALTTNVNGNAWI